MSENGASVAEIPRDDEKLRDALARGERLAYGYELMYQALCHMAGTSGAEGRWYMRKAQEVHARVSPVWDIRANSNQRRPGDCLAYYRTAVPNRAALSRAKGRGSTTPTSEA